MSLLCLNFPVVSTSLRIIPNPHKSQPNAAQSAPLWASLISLLLPCLLTGSSPPGSLLLCHEAKHAAASFYLSFPLLGMRFPSAHAAQALSLHVFNQRSPSQGAFYGHSLLNCNPSIPSSVSSVFTFFSVLWINWEYVLFNLFLFTIYF